MKKYSTLQKSAFAWLLTGTLLTSCSCGDPEITREHVPETGTVTFQANGLEFHAFEQGDGPLVLLLHGFPDTPHTWDKTLPVVADLGYHAVAPFMRGYAPSELPLEDPSHETLAKDVIAMIDAHGEESAILIAHDWGAGAAYAAAAMAPERIEQMIIVAIAPPKTLDPSLSLLWSGRHFFRLAQSSAVSLMQRDDFAHVDTLYNRWAPSWNPPAERLEAVKNAFALEESLDAALGYYRGVGLDESFFDAPISVPTTLVAGREDLIPETVFTEDAQDGFSGPLDVHILQGGHFVHNEQPDAFHDIIRQVLTAP